MLAHSMPSAYKNNTNKNEINVIFLLTLSAFSGKLYPVSERNTMNNQMTLSEIRKHIANKRKREAVRANLKRIGEAAALRAESLDHMVEVERCEALSTQHLN